MGDDHDPIKSPFEVWKKRFKKSCCAVILLLIIGPCLCAAGIGLLVKFVEYWGDEKDDIKAGLSYFGLALLLLGVLLTIIGIIIIVILVIIYKRIDNSANNRGFRPPPPGQYGPGKAPYPVQEGWTPQGIPGFTTPAAQVTAPLRAEEGHGQSTEGHNADTKDVHVEITPSTQF